MVIEKTHTTTRTKFVKEMFIVKYNLVLYLEFTINMHKYFTVSTVFASLMIKIDATVH